jgi:hypothetical protein
MPQRATKRIRRRAEVRASTALAVFIRCLNLAKHQPREICETLKVFALRRLELRQKALDVGKPEPEYGTSPLIQNVLATEKGAHAAGDVGIEHDEVDSFDTATSELTRELCASMLLP